MIAVDTGTWVAFFAGAAGKDTDLLEFALRDRQVLVVPVVLTELLSSYSNSRTVSKFLTALPLIEIRSGYWHRAGELRAKVASQNRKARLGDALIAQCCLDRDIPLLTRDRDFQAFATDAGLNLVI